MPDPAGGVVAAEVSQGGDRFFALRAWLRNGVVYVAPLVVTESEDEFWTALDAVFGDLDQLAITPTLQIHLPSPGTGAPPWSACASSPATSRWCAR